SKAPAIRGRLLPARRAQTVRSPVYKCRESIGRMCGWAGRRKPAKTRSKSATKVDKQVEGRGFPRMPSGLWSPQFALWTNQVGRLLRRQRHYLFGRRGFVSAGGIAKKKATTRGQLAMGAWLYAGDS